MIHNDNSKSGLRIVAIIPARYQSSRFEGKPLADLDGWPMIRHVYERTRQAGYPQRVIVATDDQRIKEAVEAFGGEAMMTSAYHQSGTDRLAEVAEQLEVDIIVNVQGDEPLIEPAMIDQAVEPLLNCHLVEVATLKFRITDDEELNNPNVVKVITDLHGEALYFSRWPLPYNRQLQGASCQNKAGINYYKHIGLYVYRKKSLLEICQWPVSAAESAECLEQLRILENGHQIRVVETEHNSWGVDTPADLNMIRQRIKGKI